MCKTGTLVVMTVSQRYLERLGVERPDPTADPVAVLDDLLTRHTAAIPFENLDPLTGRGVSILPEQVAAKLLAGHRGGYCHEHALLSQLVLRELGFSCFGVLARVYRNSELNTPPGKTHHATLVQVGDQLRLFDPGFGGGTPTRTLPVRPGAQVGDFRLVAADKVLPGPLCAPDAALLLQRRSSAGMWVNFYGFDPVPALPADISVSNWFVSTNPEVMFTRFPVLARYGADGSRYSLNARTLRTTSPAGEKREEISSVQRFSEVAREVFGIAASDELVRRAWHRMSGASGRSQL